MGTDIPYMEVVSKTLNLFSEKLHKEILRNFDTCYNLQDLLVFRIKNYNNHAFVRMVGYSHKSQFVKFKTQI